MSPHEIEVVYCWDHEGKPQIQRLDPEAVYNIHDSRPFLSIRHISAKKLGTRHPAAHLEKMSPDEVARYGLKGEWYKLIPIKQISQERSFGFIRIKLYEGIEISCYLLPAKLLTVDQVVWMVRDIESEVGIAPLWAPDGRSPLRPYVDRTPSSTTSPFVVDLIEDAFKEYVCATQLQRKVRDVIGPRMLRSLPTVEESLQAAWARQRVVHLSHCIHDLECDLHDIDIRLSDPRRNHERAKLTAAHAACQKNLKRAVELRQRIVPFLRPALNTALQLTPAMQRDHRLRRLLRAFKPRTHQVWRFTHGSRSTLPPTRLPDLFEIWVAVTIVKWLTQMGFRRTAQTRHAIRSEGTLIGLSWVLQGYDAQIVVDYEPNPPFVEYIPPVHDRKISALEWAGRLSELGAELFSIADQSAPDYILRITGARGRALAIGDATLADPDYAKPGASKVQKIERYRWTIGWSTPPSVTTCHLKGAFAVYPGPEAKWEAMTAAAARSDCQLIFASPAAQPEEPPDSFVGMIRDLVSAVV